MPANVLDHSGKKPKTQNPKPPLPPAFDTKRLAAWLLLDPAWGLGHSDPLGGGGRGLYILQEAVLLIAIKAPYPRPPYPPKSPSD